MQENGQDIEVKNKATEKRKKICFVITKGVWGGAQKYVYNIAVELPKDEYDVVVVTGAGDVLKEKLEEKGIRVRIIENLRRDISILSEIKSFFTLFRIILSERPDVLHLNSPKAGGLGSLIGRILFIKKIIFTAHGWTFNEKRPLYQNTAILVFSWLTILFSHKVIVIAPREEEQAKSLPLVNNRKIILIRNGTEDIGFFDREKAREELAMKAGLNPKDRSLWVGTIAELHRNKGYSYAIEAVSKIKTDFVYIIIGEGEERKNLEELIKKYGLENKVFLAGFIGINAKEYLKAFDIFMLTSIKEGLPYTILEAGLASLPVIASSVGGIPDIIENGKSGILTTKARSGEITRALEYLIDKPAERKLFGENLKAKVEKDFSLAQMIEKTIKLYTLN